MGIEHIGLASLKWLELPGVLKAVGFNGVESAVAIGSIIARMAEPGSETATWQWLRERSGLGELIDFDYESISPMRLYRTSDLLIRHRDEIEKALFSNIRNLFNLTATVTLYRSDKYIFRRRSGSKSQGAQGTLERKARRLPLGDSRSGFGRQRLCPKFQNVRWKYF